MLYSKLECGHFPLTVAIAERISNYIQDKKAGKDIEIYNIHSEQAKMRKSNEKLYDKLVKSSIGEKSPKKDKINPPKSEKKDNKSPEKDSHVIPSKTQELATE